MAEPGESIAGYVVESVLGSGGMGTVYRVRHRTLPRSVALKVLQSQLSADPSVRARFDREADIIAGLKHPHIVDVYDRGETDGHLWIAMELVEGGNLATIVRREGPFSLDRTVGVIEQVADALDYAHQHGILHRDVKPANFLVDHGRRGEQVKLADFGIGAAQTEVGQNTQTGTVVGTLAYTAPEALLGNPIDPRADVYSLACATVVLLTGAPPFTTSVSGQLMLAHISQHPPSIRLKRPDLSPEVDFVLTTAMAKSPAGRYSSAGEFAAALSQAAARMSGGAGTAPPVVGHAPNWQGTPSNPALATGFNPVGAYGNSDAHRSSGSHPVSPPPHFAQNEVGRTRRRATWLIAGAVATVLVIAAAVSFVVLGGGGGESGPALDAWSARTVTDVNGETTLDQRPERIVALGPRDAELVSALGFEVVAGANGPKSSMPEWVPSLKNVSAAGTSTQPDTAAIEKVKPDLIIDTDPEAAGTVKNLTSVSGAKVLAAPSKAISGWDWREQLAFIADALGAKGRAAEVTRTYDQRVLEVRSAHSEFDGRRLDVVSFDGRSTRVASKGAAAYQFFNRVGFSMLTPADGQGTEWLTVVDNDMYKLVSSSSVDFTVVARTDANASNGGFNGLPATLTYGVPLFIIDSSNGVDALLYGGPLAIDTMIEKVLPVLSKGIG